MKKIISLVLMLAMLLTALPAMADNVRTSGDFQYTIKGNGTATIVGYTGEYADIILPNLIDGYPITTIGEGAFALDYDYWREGSFSVTLPDTITSIEAHAFTYRNLLSINIPDAVEYIGYGAFVGNDTVQFRISNNHPYFATIDGSLYCKKDKELLKCVQMESQRSIEIPDGIISIGDYAFAEMEVEGNCFLPKSLQKIGNYSFRGFDCFNGLVIPESVCEIGSYAFQSASLYDGLEFSKGLNIIKTNTFEWCNTIGQTTLDNLLLNVEEIEPYAFSGIRGVSQYSAFSIKIPNSCKIVGEGAFYGTAVEEIIFDDGVERIESKAFLDCEYSGNIYLPASLTYIALDAFDKEVTYVVEKGSYAERWVRDNAFTYTVNGEEQNLDWLNN